MKKLLLTAMLTLTVGVAQATVGELVDKGITKASDAVSYLTKNAQVTNDSDYVIFATDYYFTGSEYTGLGKTKSDYARIFPNEMKELDPSGVYDHFLQAEVGADVGRSPEGKRAYKDAVAKLTTHKITQKNVDVTVANGTLYVEQSGGELKAKELYTVNIKNKSDQYPIFFAESTKINAPLLDRAKFKYDYTRILPKESKTVFIPVSDTIQFEVGQPIGASLDNYKKLTEVKAKGTNKRLKLDREVPITVTVDAQANPKYVTQK